MKAKWLLALPAAVLTCGIVLAACGGGSSENAHEAHTHNGEIWELKPSYAEMPAFLGNFTERTKHLYSIVGDYEAIMKTVHCYCGCMEYENDPHDSLYRCYVASKSEDGVTWTDHSALCGICTDELADIEKWSQEGKTAAEINQLIEEHYNPNYNA